MVTGQSHGRPSAVPHFGDFLRSLEDKVKAPQHVRSDVFAANRSLLITLMCVMEDISCSYITERWHIQDVWQIILTYMESWCFVNIIQRQRVYQNETCLNILMAVMFKPAAQSKSCCSTFAFLTQSLWSGCFVESRPWMRNICGGVMIQDTPEIWRRCWLNSEDIECFHITTWGK